MNIAKQFIGEVREMVRRWEQQLSKNGNEERITTTAVTHADDAQTSAASPRPAVSLGTKSSSPPRSS